MLNTASKNIVDIDPVMKASFFLFRAFFLERMSIDKGKLRE